MRTRDLPSIAVAALALLLCGSGCAVVTVDVDVYKGPLANHVDVQREQAAITALAAKPLLGKLRYELEHAVRYRFAGRLKRRDELKEIQFSDDYVPSSLPVPAKVKGRPKPDSEPTAMPLTTQLATTRPSVVDRPFTFESWQAAFVNRLLAEFNDKEESAALLDIIAGKASLTQLGAYAGSSQSTANVEEEDELGRAKAYANVVAADSPMRARARGRAGPGLETLIYFYSRQKEIQFRKSPQGQIPPHTFSIEEAELFDALIHFSQKILFAANEDVLFAERRGAPQLLSAEFDNFFNGGSDPVAIQDSYVRVLQSIGNSILVSLDELRVRYQYEQDQRHARIRERLAIHLAWDRDPWQVLHDLTDAIQAEAHDLDVSVANSQATDGAGTSPVAPPVPSSTAPSAISTAPSSGTTPAGDSRTTAETVDPRVTRRDLLLKVLDVLERQAAPVIIETAATTRPDGHAFLDGLLTSLRELRTRLAKDPKADLSAIDEAIRRVQAIPSSWALDPVVNEAKDATGLMDDVLAVLRHDKIRAIREEGNDSRRVSYLNQAIIEAQAQRADMQYIRPASAFLRTSFPATSLQRDARLGFHNLLAEHMSHQLPFADLFANGRDYRTLLELDKQYWQNINTVRVVGGGQTNYVIAKDDIGNWYVKNYSADPKDVIKSAQALAMFSLGPSIGMGSDLLLNAAKMNAAASIAGGNKQQADDALNTLKDTQQQVSAGQGAGQAAAPPGAPAAGAGSGTTPATQKPAAQPAPASGSVLLGELKSATDAYTTKTADDLTSVQGELASIPNEIKQQWQADSSLASYPGRADFEKLVDKNAAQYLKADAAQAGATSSSSGIGSGAAATPPLQPSAAGNTGGNKAAKSSTSAGDQIIDDLQSMRRFHNAVAAGIRQSPTTQPSDSKLADTAQQILRRVVRDTVHKDLRERQQIVNDYQVSLNLINAGAGQ